MEYTSNKLSKMSGVSARTLRHYDDIGLLKPKRVASSGYRIYGQHEVDTLQQVLLYRELGFSLDCIKKILLNPIFDQEQAFLNHLTELHKKRDRLDVLINNVSKSISAMKGATVMPNQDKFEGFKQSLIEKNEKEYGEEIRKKYGDKAIDNSNAHLRGLTQMQYMKSEELRTMLEEALITALKSNNPASEEAQKACDLHREWLCVFYPDYSKEYHIGLSEMYIEDERFKAHYDKIAPGCAEFLRDAIQIYCQ